MVTGNVCLAPKYFLTRIHSNQNEDDPGRENLGSAISRCPAFWLNDQLISRQEEFNKGRGDEEVTGHIGRRAGSTGRRKGGDTSGDGWGVESQPCPLHASQSLVTIEPRLHLRFMNGDETMRWTYCDPEKMLKVHLVSINRTYSTFCEMRC